MLAQNSLAVINVKYLCEPRFKQWLRRLAEMAAEAFVDKMPKLWQFWIQDGHGVVYRTGYLLNFVLAKQ